MPRGARPGERRGGGRVKGQKNKATIERELMIKGAQEKLGLGNTPIAKDALAEIMQYFLERAREAAAEFLATPKPVYSGKPMQRKEMRIAYEALESRASRYMRLTAEVADKLVAYQSPKLSHTTMVQPDPYEHMTDDELHQELVRRAKEIGITISRLN